VVAAARATTARVVPPHAPQRRPSDQFHEQDHHALDGRPVLVPVKAPRWRSARAGGAASTLTGHSNEPETGNYVMVPRQVLRPCMALTESGQDAAMDDMVEPQDARDVLPIPRCRQLLGDEAIDLTDGEVEEIRRHAHVLAHALLEVFLQHRAPAE
jgi:hypothetical protein